MVHMVRAQSATTEHTCGASGAATERDHCRLLLAVANAEGTYYRCMKARLEARRNG
jgi:hypothetical protein